MPQRIFVALALAAAVSTAAALPARAQTPAAPDNRRNLIGVPLQDLPPGDTLTERAGELWGDLLGMLGFQNSSTYFMRSHSEMARGRADTRDDFTWLMDVAGYKLKEIESSIGLVPTLSLTFGHSRELTAADRDYVERSLARHAQRNPGPIAAMQRSIVHAILDASELGGFAVEKVEVDLFPLPRVKFALAPSDAPLGMDAARIMRAIDALNRRLQQMPQRPSGVDTLPWTPSPPSLRPVRHSM